MEKKETLPYAYSVEHLANECLPVFDDGSKFRDGSEEPFENAIHTINFYVYTDEKGEESDPRDRMIKSNFNELFKKAWLSQEEDYRMLYLPMVYGQVVPQWEAGILFSTNHFLVEGLSDDNKRELFRMGIVKGINEAKRQLTSVETNKLIGRVSPRDDEEEAYQKGEIEKLSSVLKRLFERVNPSDGISKK